MTQNSIGDGILHVGGNGRDKPNVDGIDAGLLYMSDNTTINQKYNPQITKLVESLGTDEVDLNSPHAKFILNIPFLTRWEFQKPSRELIETYVDASRSDMCSFSGQEFIDAFESKYLSLREEMGKKQQTLDCLPCLEHTNKVVGHLIHIIARSENGFLDTITSRTIRPGIKALADKYQYDGEETVAIYDAICSFTPKLV